LTWLSCCTSRFKYPVHFAIDWRNANREIIWLTDIRNYGSYKAAGVWQTTDGGITWKYNEDLPMHYNLSSLTIDPNDPTKVFYTTFGGGMWYGDKPVDNTSNCNLAVLPVELTEFKATCENGTTILKWQTASETNNSHFVVETNRVGFQNRHDFEEIGKIDGNGTTSNISNYTFNHKNEDAKTVYYRLKQVDLDGNFEYSNTIAVDCWNEKMNFKIFPNPTNGQITLQFDKAISNEILIFDVLGRLVFNDFIKNKDEVQLDLKLSAGVYFLKIGETIERIIFN
jgi:hypothetical protein